MERKIIEQVLTALEQQSRILRTVIEQQGQMQANMEKLWDYVKRGDEKCDEDN